MKVRNIVAGISLLCVPFAGFASDSFDEAVASWKSYEDVGTWLNSNFYFDKSRQSTIQKRLKAQGPPGLLVRAPEKLFKSREGYCADAANFAIKALNKIDPSYNARWVFISNAAGRPNHWVAAFDYNDKLYIMDYGAGKKWSAMTGIHGPFDSLEGYRDFLASLSLPSFAVGDVQFREIPGQED